MPLRGSRFIYRGWLAPDWTAATVPADAAGAAESLAVFVTFPLADRAGAADQLASPAAVTVADTAGAREAAPVPVVTAALAEAAGAAETPAATVTLAVADTAAAADQQAAPAAVPIADAGAGAEAPAVSVTASVADAAGAAEAQLIGVSQIDSAGSAESLVISAAASPAEPAAAQDALAVAVSADLPQAAGAIDAVSVLVGNLVAWPEAAGAADLITALAAAVPLPERAGAADAITVTITAALSDRAGGADTFAAGNQAAPAENAGAADRITVTVTSVLLRDQAGAAEVFGQGEPRFFDDMAAGSDVIVHGLVIDTAPADSGGGAAELLAVAVNIPVTRAETGAAADGLAVVKAVPAPVPGPPARVAVAMFIRSAMPRMHLQNLVTGQWLHRDVQGVSSPNITWVLNGPDTFTCTLAPPRPDLLDVTGNPVAREWQTACYLEESGEIRFGGILTSSAFSGPQWQPTFTGFTGYAAGTPYEGAVYKRTRIDALDVVRYLWAWLQDQPGGNIGLDVAATSAGVLLGSELQAEKDRTTTLAKAIKAGVTSFDVTDPTGFAAQSQVLIGTGTGRHTITKISKNTFTIDGKTALAHGKGEQVSQAVPAKPVPYELDWWNSTDIGQEIANIAAEAVFEMREAHSWTDAARSGVRHRLLFGVPRLGTRREELRFCEGENIIDSIGGQRDGSSFANHVVGLGAGQGKAQVRADAAQPDGNLRRVFTFTDQTVSNQARMQSKIQRILASRLITDTPAQVVVTDHPNAPFGSFMCGDDIYVRWVAGWRNTAIWCRIISISQDPTTRQATLTLARSDSFTYLQQAGQAGTT